MPPSDPAAVPPPAWAVNLALEEFYKDRIDLGSVDPLARLLASVREGAIREAADRLDRLGVVLPDCSAVRRETADKCRAAILSLLHTPPSGGAG